MEIIITIKDDGKEEVMTKVEKIESKKDQTVQPSQYARFFDESCHGWSKDPEANLLFLKLQQEYANSLLRSRGYMFLNEVYEMLGIPKSKEGQLVGWVYNEENPTGDNYIDFGIFAKSNSKFVNGYERNILLDFNVDGCIF